MKKIISVLISALFLSACTGRAVQSNNIEPRKVRGAAAVVREIPDETSSFGSLSFITKVDVAAPQDGVVKKLYFREGDFVHEGALLLLLDNPQIGLAVERVENNYSQTLAACELGRSRLLEGRFQAEAQLLLLEKSEAELALIKRKYEEEKRKHQNQETLFSAGGVNAEAILVSRFTLDSEWEQILIMEKELEIRKIGTRDQDLLSAGFRIPQDENERCAVLVSLLTVSLKAELDAAFARLDAAEKELASVKIARDELAIRSPASGVIGARYVEEGERVRTEDKIFSLMDTESMYAIFPVREKDAIRIEKGMRALVQIDGIGESREGVIDLVYPQADIQSLSFVVRVLIEGGSAEKLRELKPGMFARVAITLGSPRKIITIPETAVFNRRESFGSVFVLNGSAVAQRAVELGQIYGDDREAITGIEEGDIVIIRPDADLKEGEYAALWN